MYGSTDRENKLWDVIKRKEEVLLWEKVEEKENSSAVSFLRESAYKALVDAEEKAGISFDSAVREGQIRRLPPGFFSVSQEGHMSFSFCPSSAPVFRFLCPDENVGRKDG